MNTSYEECYEAFLSHVQDPDILYPAPSESVNDFEERINALMLNLFKSAIPKFFFAKTSLTRFDQMEMFANELRPVEIEIIGLLMLKEYYRRQLDFLVALKHSFSDKDFKSHDKSNALNQYRQLLKETNTEIQTLLRTNSLFSSNGELQGWWGQ